MPNRFASGKHSIAECDRCGQRYMLKVLKKLVIKTKTVNILVCPECWEPDQPQLRLGMYPVNDPQAVREPRPDISYYASGTSGLQIDVVNNNSVDSNGYPELGSRIIEWGWYPVGGSRSFDRALTPNALVATGTVNSVTISTTQEFNMGFRKAADGITKSGKTKGTNLGDSGPNVKIENGPMKHTVGKTNKNMKSMGRNMAKVAAQRGR